MKISAVLLTAALATFSSGLTAQDDVEDAPQESSADFSRNSFTLGLGIAQGQNMDIPSPCYYSYCGRSFDTPKTGAAVDLRYGFKFTRNWEMTVGTSIFLHDAVTHYNYDHIKIYTFQVGVKYHWYPASTSKFNLYGGAEVGYARVDLYGRIDYGAAYSLSTGAEYFFTRHFGMRLDARRLLLNMDGVRYYDYVARTYHNTGKPGEMTFGLGVIIPW